MSASNSPRIAVVDDNAQVLRLIELVLSERGYEVVVFRDGAEALLEIPQGHFDAVITDLNMPRLDGLSLCRALRVSFTPDMLPIVVLSARESEEDVIAAHGSGANDYLVKPFTPGVLLAKIGLLIPPPTQLWKRPLLKKESRLDLRNATMPAKFGAYELTEVLGRGGSAVVFRARRKEADEDVALKVLELEAQDPDDLARYFREIASLALVESPHVVPIVDYGEASGRRYLAMKLIEGISAHQELARSGPWPLAKTLRLGLDVCSAAAALQERDLIHRDIKPGNILVQEDGCAVLIDLGLVKASRDHSLTSDSHMIGTLDYMAPEVVSEGGTETLASDLYALGVTLYKLLTGVFPFPRASTAFDLAEQIVGQRAPALSSVRPSVPQEVSDLVTRLLAKAPSARPSLAETREGLERALASLEPTSD